MIFYEGSQFPAELQGRRLRLPSTAHGTAPSAPATKSSACPCTTATPPANTKTSSPAYVGNGDGDVWGRPVGVAVAHDGSLFVTDDGSQLHLARNLHRQIAALARTELGPPRGAPYALNLDEHRSNGSG